ncbi:hypothetical protein IB211_01162c [Intestinimonas butyriciproducens]|uniref:Uncharacterized protein n=1 Tax=Intestinimonas butyriciproducens TaxID=1297617 RepID=A0A0S2W2L9_9FIRM|nr:hypothetical protein IB211_01162c [Intestinimonas butyriciproducens]
MQISLSPPVQVKPILSPSRPDSKKSGYTKYWYNPIIARY